MAPWSGSWNRSVDGQKRVPRARKTRSGNERGITVLLGEGFGGHVGDWRRLKERRVNRHQRDLGSRHGLCRRAPCCAARRPSGICCTARTSATSGSGRDDSGVVGTADVALHGNTAASPGWLRRGRGARLTPCGAACSERVLGARDCASGVPNDRPIRRPLFGGQSRLRLLGCARAPARATITRGCCGGEPSASRSGTHAWTQASSASAMRVRRSDAAAALSLTAVSDGSTASTAASRSGRG